MPPKLSKWKILFLALVILSLYAWGGLIWLTGISSQQSRVKIETKARAATFTVEAFPPSPANASPIAIPVIGSTMIGADGAILVYVPEGEFAMGSDVDLNEQPVHRVKLDAFWIDQTEITNELFAVFVDCFLQVKNSTFAAH